MLKRIYFLEEDRPKPGLALGHDSNTNVDYSFWRGAFNSLNSSEKNTSCEFTALH